GHPLLGFLAALGMKRPRRFPDVLEHMNDVDHYGEIDAVVLRANEDVAELRLVAVHQRHPALLVLRVAARRLFERLVDDALSRDLEARPDPLVLGARALRARLSDGSQLPRDVLGSPYERRNAVDSRHHRHALGIALLALALAL